MVPLSGLLGWVILAFAPQRDKVLSYIDGDSTTWEAEPLIQLAKDQQLSAYEHSGFWQSMDTLRDKNHLEQLWQSGEAPWKQWD